ncbi:phosphate ABC transporter substrate-binding protein, partial [Vibrio makurazakiensis]
FLGTTGELVEKIESESASIGYAVYSDQIEETKWLSIIDNQGMTYDVNKETILSGRYPLANVYYMYIDLPPHRKNFTEDEQFFIELTLSENHKEALNQYGFISLPQEAIHRNKVRLSLVKPIIEGGYK